MKALSVLIPYRGRLEHLRILAESLGAVRRDDIEFHLISLGDQAPDISRVCREAGLTLHYVDYSGVFRIGLALNYGADVSSGEYILKQDVDCLPYEGFYDRLLEYLRELRATPTAWANIGAFDCARQFSEEQLVGRVPYSTFRLVKEHDEYKNELKRACGNNFLVSRLHYLKLGGTSDRFQGWGWEDYQVIYYLQRSSVPTFRLSSYQLETVAAACRDEISRVMNLETNDRDLAFLHRWHDPEANDQQYMKFVEHNRAVLFELLSSYPPR